MPPRPTGSMRGGSPMRCGARAWWGSIIRRPRFATCASCVAIGVISVRMQASLKQRIQALLLRHGVVVPVKGLFTARGGGMAGHRHAARVGGRQSRRAAPGRGRRAGATGARVGGHPHDGRDRSDRPGLGRAAGLRAGVQRHLAGRDWHDERAFPMGRTWRAMPGWCRASSAVRRGRGADGSPRPDQLP